MKTFYLAAAVLSFAAVAACSDEPDLAIDRDTLSQRQRDSLVGASSLPGAQGVRGALDGADSAAARAARLEAAEQP
ncbi:MAG: hypothetical protein H0X64_03415 [Gemmatimonadaceae bacterium]|nr:hypothetical protein [Gemmatimonadaceae bacterium]